LRLLPDRIRGFIAVVRLFKWFNRLSRSLGRSSTRHFGRFDTHIFRRRSIHWCRRICIGYAMPLCGSLFQHFLKPVQASLAPFCGSENIGISIPVPRRVACLVPFSQTGE
jgi:hypothetical protein